MGDEEWTKDAACRGMPPELFFPDRDEPIDEALTVCASCPVRMDCLEWALRTREDHGVFGGMSADRRRHLWRAAKKGPGHYQRALGREIAELGRRVSGHDDDRPWVLERPCPRCPSTIPPGRHPIDRNGSGATCGNPSTYNKGCRCGACRWGKTKSNLWRSTG